MGKPPSRQTAVKELVAADYWRGKDSAYVIAHHADVIRGSIIAQRKQRERNRRSQQTWRNRHGDAESSADIKR